MNVQSVRGAGYALTVEARHPPRGAGAALRRRHAFTVLADFSRILDRARADTGRHPHGRRECDRASHRGALDATRTAVTRRRTGPSRPAVRTRCTSGCRVCTGEPFSRTFVYQPDREGNARRPLPQFLYTMSPGGTTATAPRRRGARGHLADRRHAGAGRSGRGEHLARGGGTGAGSPRLFGELELPACRSPCCSSRWW